MGDVELPPQVFLGNTGDGCRFRLSRFPFYFLSRQLVLEKLMLNVVNVAVLAVFIIFQPEIRLALSKIRIKGRKYREIHEFDIFLDNLTKSVYRLSDKQIGALIVLENQDTYEEYSSSAVQMNALFSSELLESIFMTTTPLHDGAVVIRGLQIAAAARDFVSP